MHGFVWFLGCVNLLAFFVADLYFAFVLSQLKRDHPSIDECAPPVPDTFGGGDAAASHSAAMGGEMTDDDARFGGRAGYGHMPSEGEAEEMRGARHSASTRHSSSSAAVPARAALFQSTPNDPISLVIDAARNKENGEIAALFGGLNPRELVRSRSQGVYNDLDARERGDHFGGVGGLRSGGGGTFGFGPAADSVTQQRQRLVHIIVITASFAAPFFSLLQVLAPSLMGWSTFHVPSVVGFLVSVPTFALVGLYGSRATRVGSFAVVSRAQWLSLAWFRLDCVAMMALLLLIGWGDWLVSLCLLTVGAYMAFRLLETERRLAEAMQDTQLLRAQQQQHDKSYNNGYNNNNMSNGYGNGSNNNRNNDDAFNGLDEAGKVVMGMRNGTGVVRAALVASERFGGAVGGGAAHRSHMQQCGYGHPDDIYEGIARVGEGGAANANPHAYTNTAAGYGGFGGGGGGSYAQQQHHNGPDFGGNNQPVTDSEAEGGGHYSSLSAGEGGVSAAVRAASSTSFRSNGGFDDDDDAHSRRSSKSSRKRGE